MGVDEKPFAFTDARDGVHMHRGITFRVTVTGEFGSIDVVHGLTVITVSMVLLQVGRLFVSSVLVQFYKESSTYVHVGLMHDQYKEDFSYTDREMMDRLHSVNNDVHEQSVVLDQL